MRSPFFFLLFQKLSFSGIVENIIEVDLEDIDTMLNKTAVSHNRLNWQGLKTSTWSLIEMTVTKKKIIIIILKISYALALACLSQLSSTILAKERTYLAFVVVSFPFGSFWCCQDTMVWIGKSVCEGFSKGAYVFWKALSCLEVKFKEVSGLAGRGCILGKREMLSNYCSIAF